MAYPKISVIILNYNFEKYIGECIESLLSQTLTPYEIIICDDCSPDNSWAVISKYQQRHPELVKAYRHERNIGISQNARFSFSKTSGELVSRLSGDDFWLPQKLEYEWRALEKNPEARIAYSNIYTVSPEGDFTGIYFDGKGTPPPEGEVLLQVYSRRFFQNSKSIFRNPLIYRDSWEQTGDCDLDLKSYMDWDLRIRLTSKYKVAYSGEALVVYRQHKGGISRSNPVMNYHAMVTVYEKHQKLLSNMSTIEQIQVRCNIESIFALRQLALSESAQLERYAAPKVFNRILKLINTLPESSLQIIDDGTMNQFLLLTLRLSRDNLLKGHLHSAINYYRTFLKYNNHNLNLKRIAKILLPSLYTFGLSSKNYFLKHRGFKAIYPQSTIDNP
jgi:glycosyltransferase involved in cell wall biosynthesis